jgi:hypothetical protein
MVEKQKIDREKIYAMLLETMGQWEDSKDNVNHPSHYEQSTSIECIEAMEFTFGPLAEYGFCICNAFKYIWRHKHKNGEEDLKKADWYLKKAREFYDTFDEVSCYYDEDQLQRLISLRDQKDDQWQESH